MVFLALLFTLFVVVLSVFLPGMPEGASFDDTTCCVCNCLKDKQDDEDLPPEINDDDDWLKDIPELDDEDEDAEGTLENPKRRRQSRTPELRRISKQLSVKSSGFLKKELDRRDTLILDQQEFKKLPSFMTIMYLIFVKDLFSLSFKNTKTYIICLCWKMKCLFKLTFGLWDDDLLRGMQIHHKSNLYDEDPDDDTDHHDDMIRLKGKSHALIWQFSTTLLIISKFSEAINESPLWIKPDKEDISVPPICERAPFPPHFGCIRICLSWLYRAFLGRIATFIFSIISLMVAVVILVNPDGRFLVLYLLFIMPQKVARMFENSELIASRFRHVAKVLVYYGCVKLDSSTSTTEGGGNGDEEDRKLGRSNSTGSNDPKSPRSFPPTQPPHFLTSSSQPRKSMGSKAFSFRRMAKGNKSSSEKDLGEESEKKGGSSRSMDVGDDDIIEDDDPEGVFEDGLDIEMASIRHMKVSKDDDEDGEEVTASPAPLERGLSPRSSSMKRSIRQDKLKRKLSRERSVAFKTKGKMSDDKRKKLLKKKPSMKKRKSSVKFNLDDDKEVEEMKKKKKGKKSKNTKKVKKSENDDKGEKSKSSSSSSSEKKKTKKTRKVKKVKKVKSTKKRKIQSPKNNNNNQQQRNESKEEEEEGRLSEPKIDIKKSSTSPSSSSNHKRGGEKKRKNDEVKKQKMKKNTRKVRKVKKVKSSKTMKKKRAAKRNDDLL